MMTNVAPEFVLDSAGKTMELIKCRNGRYIASDMVLSTVDDLASLPLRHDDVMLCSYPKSGCHWLWETIRYLMLGDSDVHSKLDKESFMVELNTRENLDALESPRILNNHAFFLDQPQDLLAKRVKVVFVYRNIKDVAVSYYYHHTRDSSYKYQGSFSEYLHRFIPGLVDSGCVFQYLQDWERGLKAHPDLNIHMLSYEDMKENPMQELRRLNDFLGTRRDEHFLKMVALETSMDVMRIKKGKITAYHDSNGLPIMYRKGQVGDWMNHFNSTEAALVNDIIARELGSSSIFLFRDRIRPPKRPKMLGERESLGDDES